jgi:hypothetical protein
MFTPHWVDFIVISKKRFFNNISKLRIFEGPRWQSPDLRIVWDEKILLHNKNIILVLLLRKNQIFIEKVMM